MADWIGFAGLCAVVAAGLFMAYVALREVGWIPALPRPSRASVQVALALVGSRVLQLTLLLLFCHFWHPTASFWAWSTFWQPMSPVQSVLATQALFLLNNLCYLSAGYLLWRHIRQTDVQAARWALAAYIVLPQGWLTMLPGVQGMTLLLGLVCYLLLRQRRLPWAALALAAAVALDARLIYLWPLLLFVEARGRFSVRILALALPPVALVAVCLGGLQAWPLPVWGRLSLQALPADPAKALLLVAVLAGALTALALAAYTVRQDRLWALWCVVYGGLPLVSSVLKPLVLWPVAMGVGLLPHKGMRTAFVLVCLGLCGLWTVAAANGQMLPALVRGWSM